MFSSMLEPPGDPAEKNSPSPLQEERGIAIAVQNVGYNAQNVGLEALLKYGTHIHLASISVESSGCIGIIVVASRFSVSMLDLHAAKCTRSDS